MNKSIKTSDLNRHVNFVYCVILACFLMSNMPLYAQNFQVTGSVVDENNEAIPGVTIRLKGSTLGTVSDVNGNYKITVPEENSVLQFTFGGYSIQEISVCHRYIPVTMTSSESKQTEALKTEFKRFRVDVGAGYSSNMDGGDGVYIVNIEPKYAVTPKLSLGLEISPNYVDFGRYYYSYNFYNDYDLLGVLTTYFLTVDYYLSTSGCRLRYRGFWGVGLGLHQVEGLSWGFRDGDYNAVNYGAMLRFGLEAKHIRFATSYNFLLATPYTSHFDYISFTMGFYIGGGEKK